MDLNEANNDTNTSVDQAARQGNVVLLKELLQQGHPTNGHNNRGWRPLHEAAAGGHVECVQLLLVADDAEVDALTQGGLTALHLACEPDECHTEVVKLLLRAGANPNDDYGHYLPLSKAAINNLYDIAKLLLDAGGNPNGRPLMAAIEKGHLKIAQLLVERGAKIYFNVLQSLLTHHELEDSALIPFVDVLVNGGLDVNARSNYEGKTTDHVFRRILDLTWKELNILIKLQLRRYSFFHLAIEFEKFNTLKLMVNEGLPPDEFLQDMSSAIMDYVDGEWLDETDFGPDCQNVRMVIELDMEYDTPLGFLLSKPPTEKRVEIAKFMIDKGSSVNALEPRCLPPLVAAVKHQRARYNQGCPGLDILEYLLKNGVDVMHKISATDILPAALHISSLLNVQAFFALLVRCIPVHEIYTPWILKSLSQLYDKSAYYKVYPLWPWQVISWLNVVNAFVPQLPLDTKSMFDIHRMVEDDNLSRAWDDLDAQIVSPKKLEHLCILTVRRAVGECRGWNQQTTFLRKLTLKNEPLPDLIVDLLTFKQMESSHLSKWPPCEARSRYVMSAANNINANSNAEDDPSDEDEAEDYEDENEDDDNDDDEDDDNGDDEDDEDEDDDNDDDDDEDDDNDDDDDIDEDNGDDNGYDDGDDGNCDKDDDEEGAEEQNDDSVEEEEEEEEENMRKKMKLEKE